MLHSDDCYASYKTLKCNWNFQRGGGFMDKKISSMGKIWLFLKLYIGVTMLLSYSQFGSFIHLSNKLFWHFLFALWKVNFGGAPLLFVVKPTTAGATAIREKCKERRQFLDPDSKGKSIQHLPYKITML